MRQAFQFKLYDHKRNRYLHKVIDVAASAWNHAVALKNRYYRRYKKGLAKARLQSHLAKLRHTTRTEWFALNSQSLQAICDRLYLGWEAFFEGNIRRPPTFKKRARYRSVTFKQCGYKILGYGRIQIESRIYRFWQSRPIEGTIKTVTLRRNSLNELFVTFSCAEVPPPEPMPKTGETAGIDLGLKDFGTLNSGERLSAPLPFKQALKEIRATSRNLSRKQKGSNARNKARLELARAHERAASVRNDWQWKTAKELVNQFDTITIEDLSVAGMSRLWGRKVSDLGLSDFGKKLEHQAKKNAKLVVRYPRFSRSTGICPLCRHEHKLALWERSFECCNVIWDRDQAAAIILNEAGRGLGSGVGIRPLGDQRRPALVTAESHGL
jgi:putative transposase